MIVCKSKNNTEVIDEILAHNVATILSVSINFPSIYDIPITLSYSIF